MNDAAFCSPHAAADATEVLFCWIKDCAEIALLCCNPYTGCQLISNAIRLLLTTGLYLWPFEEWDCLLPTAQTWIPLHAMIQESFQQHLNTMNPVAGHQGYAMALPYQQNAFGVLAASTHNLDQDSVETVTTQVAALTYQHQMTANTAAKSRKLNKQQFAQLAMHQNIMHENLHQIIVQVNALTFNAGNQGQGTGGSSS